MLEPMANKSPSSFPRPPLGVLWLPSPHPLPPPPPHVPLLPRSETLWRCRSTPTTSSAWPLPRTGATWRQDRYRHFLPTAAPLLACDGQRRALPKPPINPAAPSARLSSHCIRLGSSPRGRATRPPTCAFGTPLPRTTLNFPPEDGISSRFIDEGCPHHHVPPFTKDGCCLPNATEPAELMDPSP